MATNQKRFSIGTVAATALVSFLISGVGGAALQRYLARAQPLVTVTSAGFEGPSDFVEVPDDLVALTQEDSWGKSLAKYERFAVLRDRESEAAETEARIEKAIRLAETWLRDSEKGSEQVTAAEILRHPLVTDIVFGSSINGRIRRQELPAPPAFALQSLSPVFPLFRQDDDPVLHTGQKSVRFSTLKFIDRRMYEANTLAAESFSRGSRVNMVHFTRTFLESERKSVLILKSVRERLRALMLEQARPTVSLTVHNAGATAVAFRPYFGMSVLSSDGKSVTDKYLMLIADSSSSGAKSSQDLLMSMLQDDESEESKQVKVDPYLPAAGGLAYTTIAPGASATLRLVAMEKLGPKGLQYRTNYESGLLNTRVMALTVAGDPVWSDMTVFGSNVNKAAESDLLAKLK